MLPRAKSILAFVASVALLVAPFYSAFGESPERPNDARWIPSMAVVAGATIQGENASLASFDVSNGTLLRDPAFGDDLVVSPYLGVQLEVSTPTLELIPGRPRVFVNGEVLPTFGVTRSPAKEGDPTGFVLPQLGFGQVSLPQYPSEAIKGQGSVTTTLVETLAAGAALGLSFGFEAWGRQLALKPSAGWLRYQVQVDGRVHDAVCANGGAACNPDRPIDFTQPGLGNGFARFVVLQDSESRTFDAIGPGLELELETDRFGPVGTTLFLDFFAYKVLGDRTVELADTATYTDALGGPDEYAARWSATIDPWIFRAGLGMRFQWLGSDK